MAIQSTFTRVKVLTNSRQTNQIHKHSREAAGKPGTYITFQGISG